MAILTVRNLLTSYFLYLYMHKRFVDMGSVYLYTLLCVVTKLPDNGPQGSNHDEL